MVKVCKECEVCSHYLACENGCYGSDKICEYFICNQHCHYCRYNNTQEIDGLHYHKCLLQFKGARVC